MAAVSEALIDTIRVMIYQVLKAANMEMTAFWDIELCSLVGADRRFIRAMMEGARTSETSVYFKVTKRSYIPEGCFLHIVPVC
jgi:hypothetical protein